MISEIERDKIMYVRRGNGFERVRVLHENREPWHPIQYRSWQVRGADGGVYPIMESLLFTEEESVAIRLSGAEVS